MTSRKSTLYVAAVLFGYALLLVAILLYLPTPWNYAVASLAVFKGLVFGVVMRKASTIGTKRQVPPR